MKPRLSISIANGSSNHRARGNVAPFSSVIVRDGVDSHGRVASSGTSSVLFWHEGEREKGGRERGRGARHFIYRTRSAAAPRITTNVLFQMWRPSFPPTAAAAAAAAVVQRAGVSPLSLRIG